MTKERTFTEWKAEVAKALVLRGWSRRDLADSLGYTYQYMAAVCAGTSYSRKAIKAISNELNVEPYRE